MQKSYFQLGMVGGVIGRLRQEAAWATPQTQGQLVHTETLSQKTNKILHISN